MKSLVRALIALIILTGFGGYFGYQYHQKNFAAPMVELKDNQGKIEEAIVYFEKAAENVEAETTIFETYNTRSLPANFDISKFHYRNWLEQLSLFAGLEGPPEVAFGREQQRRAAAYSYVYDYYTLGFSVSARGSLDDLTRFLFEFYAAVHLHRIVAINILPVEENEDDLLDIHITIETLILPTADRRDRLAQGTIPRQSSPRVDAYYAIANRNLLATQKIRTAADPADFTEIQYVGSVDGEPDFAIKIHTDGTFPRYRKGDLIEIGSFTGLVVDISQTDIIINVGGHLQLFTLGDKLTEGFLLPPEMTQGFLQELTTEE
jgi:hypothetical protein